MTRSRACGRSAWEAAERAIAAIDPVARLRALSELPVAVLEQCRELRGCDTGSNAAAINAAICSPDVCDHPGTGTAVGHRHGRQRRLRRSSRRSSAGPIIDELLYSARSFTDYERILAVHYDADFDRIAEFTGQPVEWVVPRGSP